MLLASVAAAQPAETVPSTIPGAAAPITIPKGLETDVAFWIRVYTAVTSDEGLLHDERNLNIVYGTVRVPQDLPPRERARQIDAARDHYADLLRSLAARPELFAAANSTAASASALAKGGSTDTPAAPPAPNALPAAVLAARAALSPEEQHILTLWGPQANATQLRDAAGTVRFQLGQADRFRAGLLRSGAWEAHIAETLANLGLPPEIAALPHVESSFNPAAYSKVGAAGLWQFMRGTGKRYLRIDDAVDERLDPFRSSEAAAQLLAYNYRLLGSWPLAITAYNHGAAGMRRAQDALSTSDYLTINRNYRSASFGFASRNFYPSFLAALTIDRNPERYFGPLERAADARFHEVTLPAFVPWSALLRATDVPRETLRELNPALRPPVFDGTRLLPRGYHLRLPPRLASWSSEKLEQRLGAPNLYAAQITPRSHVVAKGETLAHIARRYGLSTVSLAARNGLSAKAQPRRGKRLSLPDVMPPRLDSAAAATLLAAQADAAAAEAPDDSASTAAAADANVAAAAMTGTLSAARASTVYVVRRGDTAHAIAQRFGLSLADLLRFNKVRDADYVYEGQRLRLTAAADRVVDAVEPSAAEPSVADTATASASKALTPAAPTEPAESPVQPAPPPVSIARTAATTAAGTRRSAVSAGTESAAAADDAVEQADADDYSVAKDGSIRVIGAETLGHYADWLGISAAQLRRLNRLKYGVPVRLGQRLRLDFARIGRPEFENRRRAFHAQLQAEFFESRRIVGTEVYIVRRGDTLWSLTQRYKALPVWLLQQYNPDADFADLRAGAQLVVPKVE